MNNDMRISKLLSLSLRHDPSAIGIVLDQNGWTDVPILLNKLNEKIKQPITKDVLDHIVETNNKKRFAYNEDQSKIRASQGHSLNVDLQLEPSVPPHILYHGTSSKVLDQILHQGICKMGRQYAHLSDNVDTAIKVGSRHGYPSVIKIDAKMMHDKGYRFFRSENGVWLVDNVPTMFIINVIVINVDYGVEER
ncbi:MAG: RNA 2'-phosphotransferase [Methanomassiliicoccales archaeon]|jgi:putative RNA 2'-phosphotransferase